jgi:hypothetical protein
VFTFCLYLFAFFWLIWQFGCSVFACRVVVYTVEFQKRGLPHAHILVWLDRVDRSGAEGSSELPADFINEFISAELPDVRVDPLAYSLVKEFMIHGPCGRMNIYGLPLHEERCLF